MAVTVTPSSTSGTPAAISNGFAAGTITFSSLNGGTNFPACKVVVGFVNDQGTDPTSPQIGGTTATKIIDDGTLKVSLWYADVSAGTADNFTFTNGSAYDRLAVVCWQITGATSGNASSTGVESYGASNDPQTPGAVNIPSSGGAVAVAGCNNGALVSTGITVTWSGGGVTSSSGDFTTTLANKIEIAGAHSVTAGASQVITSSWNGQANFAVGMSVAAWGPASTDTLYAQIVC